MFIYAVFTDICIVYDPHDRKMVSECGIRQWLRLERMQEYAQVLKE